MSRRGQMTIVTRVTITPSATRSSRSRLGRGGILLTTTATQGAVRHVHVQHDTCTPAAAARSYQTPALVKLVAVHE